MELTLNSPGGVGDDVSQDEINQKLNAFVSLYVGQVETSTSQEVNVPKNRQKWVRPAYIVFTDIGNGGSA